MDEEKKSESSWEEAEQVGPYQLHEQVAQDEHSRGELYRATHETSGAPALVLVPSTEDGAAPLTDWQVRCISSGSPGYLAVEVEKSSWVVAPDKYSSEALVCLFEDVRDGVTRMARALPDSNEPRLRWRLGFSLAGAAAVCALAFVLLRPASVSPPPDGSELVVDAAPAPMSQEVPTDNVLPPEGRSLEGIADGGLPALTYPMPRKAYKGQKRPPCTPRVEVEIVGGCWMPHQLKAPCPEELHEYQGQCYSVVVKAPPPPQSLGQ
ncbi:hypothetical protein [Archangium lansingense]|uniref:Uncharacterized protein n=1 Tax=Archangium lansingense TaxID=2995310 RepID=A0ABT4ANH6_9BACT|nr:hypothetical protein [Archangium lansinium]MCY1083236.1 hypothetical protein [Archangium lansinium]